MVTYPIIPCLSDLFLTAIGLDLQTLTFGDIKDLSLNPQKVVNFSQVGQQPPSFDRTPELNPLRSEVPAPQHGGGCPGLCLRVQPGGLGGSNRVAA